MLADGLAVYTPGLSDHRNGASTFTHADALGSLRFLTSGQTPTASLLSDAFGETVASDPLATPFGWNGGSGYGGDWDGLSLVGHRYYDTRTGRFISQDHAHAGGNWYAYCGNDPVNASDPSGNVPQSLNGGTASINSAGYNDALTGSFVSSLDLSLAESQASYEMNVVNLNENAQNDFANGDTTICCLPPIVPPSPPITYGQWLMIKLRSWYYTNQWLNPTLPPVPHNAPLPTMQPFPSSPTNQPSPYGPQSFNPYGVGQPIPTSPNPYRVTK